MDTDRLVSGTRLSRRGASPPPRRRAGPVAEWHDRAAPGKQGKQKKFENKSKTFTNVSPITIPALGAASPYPSEIRVSGFRQGKLLDINVTLTNLSHPHPADINVQLLAPNGRRAIIMSDAGSCLGVNSITLTLDDQAAARLSGATQISSDTFKPTNYGAFDPFPPPGASTTNVRLSTFSGIDPNGTWRLLVVDDTDPDGGSIGGWSLKIKARVKK
ncbi:MAG: proprotein convertase P-domain-containing protein [Chloroflexota bacterium]|nr:proprotein convertase P-domain-containing protein [Chloroflexota bacterium]